jgi:hypothetical protein
MTDRRSEVRMLCADMVEASWTEPSGETRQMTALLEDISTRGACLQLETGVPAGVTLTWHSRDRNFTGTVRYCVYREIGYFVGVEFDAQSKWSQKAYRPRHLLDLRKMLKVPAHRRRN